MSLSLATIRIGHASASTTVVMLHGIYGRGRNWSAVAKGLVAARPDVACVLIDLPRHGDSSPGRGDTVRDVAADVAAWLDHESIRPDAILGHSFGGKVVLAMAEAWRDRHLRIWIVDSTPDRREPSGSAWDMLQAVRDLPSTFATRDDLTSALTATGWAPGVAQWMSTNLTRENDRYAWRIDFDAMERMLVDFFATDLWPVVEQAPAGHTLHFIKASDSTVMSEDAVRRADAAGPNVHVHHLQGGHWIHADQPGVVIALLAEAL